MTSILDGVDQRTQLVGKNRLELLLFRLGGDQLYGINVFKVREVVPCPPLNAIPRAHPAVRGVATIRGNTITVLDLNFAIQRPALEKLDKAFVIITEYNNSTQGFLVDRVERIVNMNWEEIKPPPSGSGDEHFLTAITHVGEEMVSVLDVEQILDEVAPRQEEISEGVVKQDVVDKARSMEVLTCDDSMIARKQVASVLGKFGVRVTTFSDGKQTLQHLRELANAGVDVAQKYVMLISDIEMPEMDGYTLTAAIRRDERMKDLYIMLHSSLSGVFNTPMVEKVGANDFLPKFQADELAESVQERIRSLGMELPVPPGDG